jgi:hypothetical protein
MYAPTKDMYVRVTSFPGCPSLSPMSDVYRNKGFRMKRMSTIRKHGDIGSKAKALER